MSAKVGIISDTHNLLRPEVLRALKKCDYILHAGDFTEPAILDQLLLPGRLYAVRGNCDGYWAHRLAPFQRFRIEELDFFMIHDRNHAGALAREADVVVFGHTHQFTEEYTRVGGNPDGKLQLWLNPGSCGWPRFAKEVTMAVMEVNGKDYKVRRIDFNKERRRFL